MSTSVRNRAAFFYLLSLAISLSMLLTACEKEDVATCKLLQKTAFADNYLVESYTYKHGLVSLEEDFQYVNRYFYDSRGRIDSVHHTPVTPGESHFHRCTFYWSGGRVDSIRSWEQITDLNFYGPGQPKILDTTYFVEYFDYRTGGLLSRYTLYKTGLGTAPELVQHTEYDYYSTGNIKEVRNYSSTGVLTYITRYAAYDNFTNPYYNMPKYPPLPTSPNNPLIEYRTSISGGDTDTIEYSYEYNLNGYPSKQYRSAPLLIDYSYIYDCD